MNSIEHNSYKEANTFKPTQEFPCISIKSNVHYCVDNSPPLLLTRNQISFVHALLSHFFTVHF